ncbi:MAG: hypothetical protein WDN10_03940 [bacterium]
MAEYQSRRIEAVAAYGRTLNADARNALMALPRLNRIEEIRRHVPLLEPFDPNSLSQWRCSLPGKFSAQKGWQCVRKVRTVNTYHGYAYSTTYRAWYGQKFPRKVLEGLEWVNWLDCFADIEVWISQSLPEYPKYESGAFGTSGPSLLVGRAHDGRVYPLAAWDEGPGSELPIAESLLTSYRRKESESNGLTAVSYVLGATGFIYLALCVWAGEALDIGSFGPGVAVCIISLVLYIIGRSSDRRKIDNWQRKSIPRAMSIDPKT